MSALVAPAPLPPVSDLPQPSIRHWDPLSSDWVWVDPASVAARRPRASADSRRTTPPPPTTTTRTHRKPPPPRHPSTPPPPPQPPAQRRAQQRPTTLPLASSPLRPSTPPPAPSPTLPSAPPPTPAGSPPLPGLPFGARHGPRARLRPLSLSLVDDIPKRTSIAMRFKPVEIRPPRAPLANSSEAAVAGTADRDEHSSSPPPPPPTSPVSGQLPQYDLPSTSTYTVAATAGNLPPGAAPPITAPIRFARAQSYDALSRSVPARFGRPESMYSTPEAGTSTPALVSSARSWALHDLPEKPSLSAPPPRDPLPRDAEPEPASQSPKSPKSEGGGMLAFLSRILKGKKKPSTVTPFPSVLPLPAAPRRAASVSTPNLPNLREYLPTPPGTPPRRESVASHTHSLSDPTAAGPSATRRTPLPPVFSLPPTPPNGVAPAAPNDRLSPGPRPNTDEGDPQSIASSASASPSTPSPAGRGTHPHRRSVVFTTPPGILLNKGEGTMSRKLQKKRK